MPTPTPQRAEPPRTEAARTRPMTVIAQDPSIRDQRGRVLTAELEIPAEPLARGPRGYRVHVIDYDSSTGVLYAPAQSAADAAGLPRQLAPDLDDPRFHAQNVYALTMKTLARFELALGRRVRWAFDGHQIKVVPHAFADANAFYSRRDEALLFGYFPRSGRAKGMVFSCLSHDVIVHETTHALLDGLRSRFMDPSSPDQAAFHEGFADLIALLSVFSLREVVETILTKKGGRLLKGTGRRLVDCAVLERQDLEKSVLLGLADEMGAEMSAVRGRALRRSVELKPARDLRARPEFREPHRRGEILVAAVLNAFLDVWLERLGDLKRGAIEGRYVDARRVSEEAAAAADYLVTMAIRALDYCPPIHLTFSDFLTAALTADREIRPDDGKFKWREHLRASCARFGIDPAPVDGTDGTWRLAAGGLDYGRVRFDSLQRDPDEVFRFVWENRDALGLDPEAYTRVESVRPCLRSGPEDGFPLRETVAECVQWLTLRAGELWGRLRVRKPDGMDPEQEVTLQGGLTLIFDDFGTLKHAIANRVSDPDAQTERLRYLWEYGFFSDGAAGLRRFSSLHRRRSTGGRLDGRERW